MKRSGSPIAGLLDRSNGRFLRARYSVLLLLPAGILFGVAFFFPVIAFLMTSFSGDTPLTNFREVFADSLVGLTLLRTLWVSAAVALICLILGLPVAYLMARARGHWATIIGAAVLVPLWTSVLMRTYAWTVLLQFNGVLNQVLVASGIVSQPLRMMYSEPAVILVMVHVLLPYMILPLYTNIAAIPRDYSRAARSLGAGDVRTAWHVLLPLYLPGIVTGSILVFVVALGFFIIPALVGGPHSMMIATLISRQVTSLLNWPLAAAMSVVLVGVTVCILAAFGRVLRLDPGMMQAHR